MIDQGADYKEELLRRIEGLPAEKIRELLDFAYFISARDAIDPSQVYFWTKNWQAREIEAERDKKAGNIIGDGTVDGLLNELKE